MRELECLLDDRYAKAPKGSRFSLADLFRTICSCFPKVEDIVMLKLKPAINTAYKRKICMYWTKKLSVSIVKAVCCISSGMGGAIKKMFLVLKMSL